jgi:hypothetical protein
MSTRHNKLNFKFPYGMVPRDVKDVYDLKRINDQNKNWCRDYWNMLKINIQKYEHWPVIYFSTLWSRFSIEIFGILFCIIIFRSYSFMPSFIFYLFFLVSPPSFVTPSSLLFSVTISDLFTYFLLFEYQLQITRFHFCKSSLVNVQTKLS